VKTYISEEYITPFSRLKSMLSKKAAQLSFLPVTFLLSEHEDGGDIFL
jgi:hypothetical protein